MPLVKILKDYKPQEGWKPGQIVEITNPWELVNQGLAVLVDEEGHEIENPDILMQIGKAVTTKEAIELIGQIIGRHPNKDVLLEALRKAGATERRDPVQEAVDAEIAQAPVVKEETEEKPVTELTDAELLDKIEQTQRAMKVHDALKKKPGRKPRA